MVQVSRYGDPTYAKMNPAHSYGGFIKHEFEKPSDFAPGGQYHDFTQKWQQRNPGGTSIGGVSAVNPQAGQANELDAFKRYEDMAFNTAMSRLDPAFAQQSAAFNQGMVSSGIPVGSDAWNSANAQLAQNQGDARQQAAFGAMQFGLGAQNQSFQQDHARSALANALLQAQWQRDLSYAGLSQNAQQFKDKLAFDYDTFYDTLGQRNYEFDAGQDFDYWDRGNYWDFAHDRAGADDFFNLYDRRFRDRSYDDSLFLSLYNQPGPGVSPQNAGGIYGTQLNAANQAYGNMLGFWGDMFSSAAAGDG